MDTQDQTPQSDLNLDYGHQPKDQSDQYQNADYHRNHNGARGKVQGSSHSGDGDRNTWGAESLNWRSEGNRLWQGNGDSWQNAEGPGKRGKKGKDSNKERENSHSGDGDRNTRGAESLNWRSEGNRLWQGNGDSWQNAKGSGKRGKKGKDSNKERENNHETEKSQDIDQHQVRRGKQRYDKELDPKYREQDYRGYVLFYQGGSVFSQWHPARFEVDGVLYNCTEQYMMHQKAVLMGDQDSADYILTLHEPRKQKEAGRNVYPWKQNLWDQSCYEIVRRGNYAKFSQNEELRDVLLETHPKTLVETNPFDKIWGIGLTMDDPKAKFQAKWKGRNLLGFILTEVRDQLMLEGHKVQGKSIKRIVGMPEPVKNKKDAQITTAGHVPTPALPPANSKDWFDEEDTGNSSIPGAPTVTSSQPKLDRCFISMMTTSSDKNSSILQLSVLSPSEKHDWYIKPSKPVSKQVEEVTGIKYEKGQMYVSGRKVEALPAKEVLQSLLDFLGEEPAYLIGHNIKSHGCYVIIEAATPAGLNERLERHLTHLVDMVSLARHHNRELKAQLSLEELSQVIMGKDIISNNTAEDVKALKRMFEELAPSEETLKECMFDYKYVMNAKRCNEEKTKNLESWQPLIKKGTVPKKIAERAARNGFNIEDLLKAYKDGGDEKLASVMSEKDSTNQPKITDKKEAIHQLCCYFKKLKA